MPILQWLTRETDLQASHAVPYRLLEPVAELSAGEPSENMLIQGENLEALKALLPFYAGKVKCVYIDPPYNTGSAFEHYDDNLEHTQWISLMYSRLELLHSLLSEDGFLLCSIDDQEGDYLRVLLDEIFGRGRHFATLYIRVRYPEKTLKQDMAVHKEVERVLVYKKHQSAKPNQPTKDFSFDKFSWYINELEPGIEVELGAKKVIVFKPGQYEIVAGEPSLKGLKEIWATGTILDGNSSGRFFRDYIDGRVELDGLGALYKVSNIGDDGLGYRYITGPKKKGATKGKYFQGVPKDKVNNQDKPEETPLPTFYDFAGSFGNCRTEGGAGFRGGKKPELFIKTMLEHFSNKNDLVLDSFLGSGTTAAVAHKMGRRYIGIEMGEHCITHCAPRLQKVIDGEQGGISEIVNWKGGGGFRFYRLGEPVFDEHGKINPAIRYAHLASHIWFCETRTALEKPATSPLLGIFNGVAYYLLYNGILGDKRPAGGNVLTNPVLRHLPPFDGPKVIYGESSRFGAEKLKIEGITFKQTPYDIKAR